MKEYRVIYTISTIIEAENEEEAISLAADMDMNDFAFIDCETEVIEN